MNNISRFAVSVKNRHFMRSFGLLSMNSERTDPIVSDQALPGAPRLRATIQTWGVGGPPQSPEWSRSL